MTILDRAFKCLKNICSDWWVEYFTYVFARNIRNVDKGEKYSKKKNFEFESSNVYF